MTSIPTARAATERESTISAQQLGEPDASILRSIAVIRLLLIVWMTIVLVVARGHLAESPLAIGAVATAGAWSAWMWWLNNQRPATPTIAGSLLGDPTKRTWLTTIELAIGAMLLTADRFVWDTNPGQRLASAWPLAAIFQFGVLRGRRAGALAGVALGLANGIAIAGSSAAIGSVREFARLNGDASRVTIGIASTIALYALAGYAAGAVTDRLRTAERTVSEAKVRAEVARELHDGVLQTLAIVQRRSEDADLAQLARDQERNLRSFLAGDLTATELTLGAAIRAQAQLAERRFGVHIQYATTLAETEDGDLGLSAHVVGEVAKAIGEALTNAGKHGEAKKITVFVDVEDAVNTPDDVLFVSVKDDGCGFDPVSTEEGRGIQQSIRARIEDIDGSVTVTSSPGSGTEVTLRMPLRPEFRIRSQ